MEVSLDCRGVGKRFGSTIALSDVDLSLSPGEIRGLVGRNGAGKSTLLRCVLGLLRPDTGTVRVLGRDTVPVAGSALDGVAGLVDGTRWPAAMRVDSVLRMVAAYDRRPSTDVEDIVERLSLEPWRRSRVGSLSLGGRQRLGVAAALLRKPRLLLLDEPVNGLDPAGRRDLRLLLRELADGGAAVVISSHDLTEIAATCETVTRLDAGTVSWTKPLSEVAHTADRRVKAATSDDSAAMAAIDAAESLRALTVSVVPGSDLMITGPVELLDQASLVIAAAGIAIRRWEPETDLAAALLAPAPDEEPQP